MGSSRLPGKVLKDICGMPMLEWVVRRSQQAQVVDGVMVATTDDPSDAPIVSWCAEKNVPCYRGSVFDVLDRFYQAALLSAADVVVRVTADCPLIDPSLIDAVLDLFEKEHADFAANRLPPPYHRTYPIGLDVEVVSFQALERAWKEAKLKFEREHVLPYLYAQEGRFKVSILDAEEDYGNYRWTVDTPEDLQFVRELVSQMKCGLMLGWKGILDFVVNNPELQQINASVQHKSFKDVDERVQDEKGSAHE